MQEEEFRRNCELRAKDEPVTNQQAIEALDHIVKNPRRDAEDTRTLNQAVSVLENFIYIHAGTESKALDTTMQEDTEAKARVYKAAVDQIADSIAAGAWQDGPAPKDGSWILGLFYGLPYVVCYDSWEISEEGGPKETEEGWCLAGQDMHPMDQDEPEKWARIIHPNRHMPASWDGPGDQR